MRDAIRGLQRSLQVIRGHPRSSEVIIGGFFIERMLRNELMMMIIRKHLLEYECEWFDLGVMREAIRGYHQHAPA